jgi:LPS-assembly lipoprotein
MKSIMGTARRAAAVGLLLLLSACGFHLRGEAPLPFDTMYVGIPDNTRFGADVRRAIIATSPNTRIVSDPKDAQASLQQVANTQTMQEVALDAQGRVEEYQLGVQFTFRVIDAKGQALLPDTTLVQYRDMPYNDQLVQAKQGEAETLYRAMRQDLISGIIRRLTSQEVRVAATKSLAGQNPLPGDTVAPVYSTTPPPPPMQPPQQWNLPGMSVPQL